jgi:hypothetical protein
MMGSWLMLDDGEVYLNMANCDSVTFSKDQNGEKIAHVHFDGGHVKTFEGKSALIILRYVDGKYYSSLA